MNVKELYEANVSHLESVADIEWADDSGMVSMVYLYLNDDGTATATAIGYDSYDFHRSVAPEYFDADGDITDAAWEALRRIFEERYSNATLSDADAYGYTFDVWVTVPQDAPEEDLYGALWEQIRQIVNETDPGTFNSPYLFGSLMADAIKTEGS